MTLVITALLLLILIALMASSKNASAAVWRTASIAIAVITALIVLLAIVFGSAAAYDLWIKDSWAQIGGLTIGALVGFGAACFTLYDAQKKGLKETIQRSLLVLAATLVFGISMAGGYYVRTEYPGLGTYAIGIPWALLGLVLIFRTLTQPRRWREIWAGVPIAAEPYFAEMEARWAEEDRERALVEAEPDWTDLTDSERDALDERRAQRQREASDRIEAVRREAETRKAEELKINNPYSVRGFFWLFSILGAFALLGVYWDYAYPYALSLDFVKGRAFFAGALVIGAPICLIGIALSLYEDRDKLRRDPQSKESN